MGILLSYHRISTLRLEENHSVLPKLADLLKYVKTSNWHRLGVSLGVDLVKLDMIDEERHRIENKLSRMFRTWLDTDEDPTWNKVVTALKDMELNVLASDIKDRFC